MKLPLIVFALFCSVITHAQIFDSVRELDELNVAGESDAYPCLTNDGLRLYYVNNLTGTNHLYFTSRPDLNSDFEPKQIVDSTTFIDPTSCWFTEDELTAYYTNVDTLFRTSRATTLSPFTPKVKITLVGSTNSFISGPSFSPNGDELYIWNTIDLMKYEYTNDTTYTFVSTIDAPTGFDPIVAQLSKDGLELFWSLAPIGTDSIYLFKLDRPAVGDDFANPVKLNDSINDGSTKGNTQASYASVANVLVWVRNDDGLWSGNDLFIAQGASTAELFEINNTPKELVKIVDFTGRETLFKPNTPLIYIYSDGSAERVFILDY